MSGGRVQLGPNFDAVASRLRPLAMRRQPKRTAGTKIPVRASYTLPQIVRAFAAEHDKRAGGQCECVFCADLRWHEQQAREKRQSGGAK